jgi:hypothetical protein
MSAVILEFIEPYRDQAHNDSELENLIALSVVAWNISLLPEDQRENALEDFASGMFSRKRLLPIKLRNWVLRLFRSKREGGSGDRPPEVTAFKEIVYEMIERKVNQYSQNRRFILSYQVKFTNSDMNLFVVSTLEGIRGR